MTDRPEVGRDEWSRDFLALVALRRACLLDGNAEFEMGSRWRKEIYSRVIVSIVSMSEID